MSKKRGLSLEEKRQRLLEIFFEKKDFFQLRELEKIAPKEKGITSMSVKDVLQSLVDDNIVDSERIGTSNYFWAFPSKALNNRKRKISELEEKIENFKTKKRDLDKQLMDAQHGRDDTTDRQEILKALAQKKKERTVLSDELEQYKLCDPDVLKEVKQQTRVAMDATNRWTENIFSLKSWCRDKFNLEESVIDKQFDIPEDLDYIT